MSSKLFSISLIIRLSLLFISFIIISSAQSNTINKVCAISGSTCGSGQACVNGLCECDPIHRRFWTGEKYQCRVCPPGYIRAPTRCYKYYKESKNRSEARASCQKDQADLFSWRDNTDENELLKASAAEWNYNYQNIQNQFYSWSGGMVHHGEVGGRTEYKITWFDPKGPTITHPDTSDPLTDRYCNAMTKTNYHGDPEPTRQIKNGEQESCVTIVFLPQPNSRGLICMADDYCSTKIGFICELTEATLSGVYQTPPTPDRIVDEPLINNESKEDGSEPTDLLAPMEEKKQSNVSSLMIYAIVFIVLLVIIGLIAFIIIRYRKKINRTMIVSPTNSTGTSMMSNGDIQYDV